MIIKFRIYSKATKGGGAVVKSTSSGGGTTRTTSSGGGTTRTTSSGGGTTATSSSGGGTSRSTQSGGGSSQTSAVWERLSTINIKSNQPTQEGGGHIHWIGIPLEAFRHSHNISIPAHTHNFSTPNHTHNVTIPNHRHDITIPNHTHSVEIPDHTHEIEIPSHTHEIEHGIFKLDRLPTKVTIKVDGNTVPYTALSGDSIDLIPYLERDSENRVKRGWHTVEITPNDLGRINAQLMVQFFMQSRGGVDA